MSTSRSVATPVGPVLALEGTGVYVSPYGRGLYVLMNRRHRCDGGTPIYFADNASAVRELEYAFSKPGLADYERNSIPESLSTPVQSDPVTGICAVAQRDPWAQTQGGIMVRYIVIVRGQFHLKEHVNHTYFTYEEAFADLQHAMRKVGRSGFYPYGETVRDRVPQPSPVAAMKSA